MEYSSSGRSEVVRSTQVETNGEFKERSTDEKATPPGTISQQLISLDEAFEPPPKYKSFQNRRDHIDNMKSRSRASRNTSSTMKLRKLSRANSNASQVNPWTPMDISAQMYPEDDLSATLQIASN